MNDEITTIPQASKNFSSNLLGSKGLGLVLYAILSRQYAWEVFLGKVRLKDLLESKQTKVDLWDPKKRGAPKSNGYQRIINPRKANYFGDYLYDQENFSPSALYINIRDNQAKSVNDELEEVYPQASLWKISIPSNVTMWVVDGQHRLSGLENILAWNNDPNIELPLILTVGLTREQEMYQFITINKARGAILTQLSERLLADAARKTPELKAWLQARSNVAVKQTNLGFIERATEVLDIMEGNQNGQWFQRIGMPNETREDRAKDQKVVGVSSKSFIDSLKPLMRLDIKNAPLGFPSADVIAGHLTNVWNGIKLVSPEMFEKNNVCNYAIQQTIGTFAIHFTLNKLYADVLNYKKLIDLTPKEWAKIFDVKALASKEWIRDSTTGKMGTYLSYGTNMKSFDLISNDIIHQINRNKENDTWKKLKMTPGERKQADDAKKGKKRGNPLAHGLHANK